MAPFRAALSGVDFSHARRATAPVAQLDRAPDYESGGRRFESFRARHFSLLISTLNARRL